MTNIDLSKIVNDSLTKYVNEKIEEKINEEFTSMLDDVIKSIFYYRSEVKETFKEKIQNNILLCFDNLKIENYNTLVIKAINQVIDQQLKERITENITKNILPSIAIADKTEYSLSEIIEEYKKDLISDGNVENEDQISVIIDKDSSGVSYTYIYLDKSGYADKRHCDIMISLNEKNEIWRLDKESTDIRSGVGLYGFDKMLFAMFANNAKINIDSFDATIYLDEEY